jgi:chemotaxis protein MotB
MKHVCPWARGLFGSILILIGLSLVVPSLFGANLETVYDRDELARMVELNNRMVGHLDEQMASIQAEIDWLGMKIKRFTDYGRVVPSEMIQSMKLKKSNLASMSRERTRLATLSGDYGARLTRLDAKLEKAKALARVESAKKIPQKVAGAPSSTAIPSGVSQAPASSGMRPVAKIGHDELTKAIQKAGLQDWVEVIGDGTCVRIENQLPILFASGKANLVKEYKGFLKKFAGFLKPYDVRIIVDGYADTDPIHTARYPSNFELGATRAANIVHELVRNGLKPSVFKIASTGEHRFHANKPLNRKLLERRVQVSVVFSG